MPFTSKQKGANISSRKSLALMYKFIKKCEFKIAIHETPGALFNNQTMSSETVCVKLLMTNRTEKPLSGQNFFVEIDEAKFGKRTFNKGRLVERQQVLGAICRETRECIIVPVPDGSAETLIKIIVERVASGTKIHTDEWHAHSSF